MTDINQEDQDVELQESEEEISEMKHDPKNAEAQSVASIDKAGDATGTAPTRKMAGGTAADNTKKDPMPKTKAGMIAGIVGKMQGMNKQSLQAMYKMDVASTDPEAFDGDPIAEKQEVHVEVDFKDDLSALVNEEATLSDEFKQKVRREFELKRIKNGVLWVQALAAMFCFRVLQISLFTARSAPRAARAPSGTARSRGAPPAPSAPSSAGRGTAAARRCAGSRRPQSRS